jgi:hypothetical protein
MGCSYHHQRQTIAVPGKGVSWDRSASCPTKRVSMWGTCPPIDFEERYISDQGDQPELGLLSQFWLAVLFATQLAEPLCLPLGDLTGLLHVVPADAEGPFTIPAPDFHQSPNAYPIATALTTLHKADTIT